MQKKVEPQKPKKLKSSIKKIVHFVLLSFVFVILVGAIFWGVQWFSVSLENLLIHKNNSLTSNLQGPIENVEASMQPIARDNLAEKNPDMAPLTLDAQSALSIKVQTAPSSADDVQATLFSKDSDKKLPIASLTKLMTALIVLDHYDLSSPITISQDAMDQEGVQGVLKLGQTLTVKDLLYITLIESSNRAAYALSEAVGPDNFVILMNERAAVMGLTNTHFQDASGLDSASYSTAGDLAKLSQYLFENYPLFRYIVGLKSYSMYLPDGTLHHKLETTNELLGQYNIIGGKTGYTPEALGCFITFQDGVGPGNYIVNIVLGSQDRFAEMKSMIDWTHSAYKLTK